MKTYGPFKAAKRVIAGEQPKPSYPPMVDVMGPHIPVTVVTAKNRGHWLIRGWCPFETPESVQAEVAKWVGCAESLEWTTHTYDVPAYLVYGSRFDEGGELDGWGWPVGVYKFPFSGNQKSLDGKYPDDSYQGPIECLREGFVKGEWATR